MTPSVVYRPIFTHSTHPSFAGPWARKRHPSHQKKHEYPDAQQSVQIASNQGPHKSMEAHDWLPAEEGITCQRDTCI